MIMKTLQDKIAAFSIAVATSAMLFTGCNSLTKTQKGVGIGAAAGAGIGAIIGKKAGNTAVGAIIGGAIGGTAGGYIGRRMDKQAAEIEQTIPNAEVIREGEGIIVKFDSGILFDFDKATLKPNAKENIAKLATSLQNNPETDILIIGHTDATGADAYNLRLSDRRADAVKSYAIANGISSARLTTEGRGETEPIADNTTEEGKAQNRRVEVVIVANDKLKAEAKQAAQ
ncbi:OmpA family protein [Flavihumibacter sp. R14]|nr:OmpA family protein [Flavihumibacter soli]